MRQTMKEWREWRGWSQADLARALSEKMGRMITQSHVHRWETGTMPGADVAEVVRRISRGRVLGDSYGKGAQP